MSGKQLYIGYHLRAGFCPSSTAHSPALADAVAGGASLKRAEHQLVMAHQIETNPEPSEALAEGSRYIGQHAHFLVFVLNEQSQLGNELAVACSFVNARCERKGCFHCLMAEDEGDLYASDTEILESIGLHLFGIVDVASVNDQWMLHGFLDDSP